MPRRKKLPETSDIIGLGNPDKLTVQKSNPLQSLAKTDLTLPELKLLDVYLARIDSHDPEKRTVIIEKGELERVLCVTRILKDDLNKRLRNLFQIVEIEDATKPDGFKIISLFEEAEAECSVFSPNRCSHVDSVEADRDVVDDPVPELFHLINGCHNLM